MKISELLVELEKIMWQAGDLDVWVADEYYGAYPPVFEFVSDAYNGSPDGLYLN